MSNITFEEGERRIQECEGFPMSPNAFARLVDWNSISPRRAAVRIGIVANGQRLLYSKETALRIWTEIWRNRAEVV